MVPNVKVQVSDLLKGAGGGLEVPPRTLRRGEGKTQSGSAPVFAGGDLPLKILVPFKIGPLRIGHFSLRPKDFKRA